MPMRALVTGNHRVLLRRAVRAAAPALVLLALGAALFHLVHAPRVRANSDRRWLDDLAFRADLRQAAIESALREAVADARVAGHFPAVQALCAKSELRLDDATRAHLGAVLAALADQDGLAGALLVSREGALLAASRGTALPAGASAAAAAARDHREARIDLRLDGSGGVQLFAAVPLECPGSRRDPTAAAVVEIDPAGSLYPLLEAPGAPGARSIESLLVHREGERLLFLSPSRSGAAGVSTFSRPAGEPGRAADLALAGESAQAPALDYRGVPVLAAVRPIRLTGWGLVVKLDLAEARAAVEQRLLMESLVGGLGLLSAGLAAAAVLAARRRLLAARLAGERARFATALEQANDAILYFDDQGLLVDVNPRAEAFYGRDRSELVGRPIAELRAPEERAALAGALERLREQGHTLVESVHLRADGARFPVEVSSRRLVNGGDATAVAIVRDLSAAREAEASFRRLFDNSPFPTWIFDLETLRFLEVNGAAVDLYGWSREEFLAMTVADIRPAADRSGFEARVASLRRDPDPSAGYSSRHLRRDGSEREVEISSFAHTFRGRAARVAIVRDVTEQNRAERELRKLTRAVEQSPATVVITDLEGRIEYVNPKFTELTGYSAAEALGQNPRILKSGLTPDETYREMWTALAAGRVWRGEICNRRKDGSLFWEAASISPLVDADGRVTHYVAVKEDVTERKRLGAELEQAHRLEAIGRLAGGVAHDVNNILAVIGGITDLVLGELPEDAPRRADLLEVRAAVERGASLTSKLLAFGRRRPGEPRAVDLAELVRGVATVLARLLGEQIELRLDLPAGLGSVDADPAGLEQVLINLALNARDAMPQGGRLTLALAARRVTEPHAHQRFGELAPGDYLELAVSDTGLGIPDAVRQRLFEPFVTTKEVGRGTGLGLAVVHGVIRHARGAIEVDSEPGRGSTFRVLLPCSARPPEPPPAPPQPAPAPAEGPTPDTATVLLAEDDRAVRSLLHRMLTGAGYRVLPAVSGDEALALLAAEPAGVALLVTDVGMPGMSGHELAERVRASHPGTPALLISGHLAEATPGSEERREVFLAKPFDRATLLAAVRAALAAGGGTHG